MLPFNYHHLYYFYMIAEEGSVTKAAEKLRLAQSSLSMQLSQFEGFLDKKLFVREGKKMLLTEDGNYILSYAKAIFDLGQELSDSLGDRAKQSQLRIQIGVSPLIAKAFVDSLLNYLLKQKNMPYIDVVEKDFKDMLKDLSTHKLDMILNDLPHQAPADHRIQNYLIASIPVALCVSTEFSKKIKKIPEDLDGQPMILPTSQSQTYHALQEYFLTHKVQPKVIAEIQDIELVRRLVLTGKGIAPINEITIRSAPSKDKLAILGKPDQLKIHDSIYLIKKERKNPHPLVEDLLQKFKIENN